MIGQVRQTYLMMMARRRPYMIFTLKPLTYRTHKRTSRHLEVSILFVINIWHYLQITHIFFSDIFPSDQYFIVFEFSNGGRDLESFEFGTQSEAWGVLHQTALGLAVAENALEFEHRDLHWGNVLICRTEDEFIESCLLGETKMVQTNGVRVSLIDFTLSRLKKGKSEVKPMWSRCHHSS